MRPKTTIALLVVTLGLIAFIVFYEREQAGTQAAIENSSRVLHFDTEEVTRIEIRNAFGEALLQKEKDGIWRLRSGVIDRLDQKLVEEILSEADKLSIYETLPAKELRKEGIKPEELGFGDSKTTIRFFKADDELAAMEIGDRTDMKDLSYLRLVGDWEKNPVHAAWSRIRDTAELPFDELRDRHLILGSAEQVREIKFVRGQASVLVEWNVEEERWYLQKPLQTRASKEAINEHLAALLATEITEFLDESDAGAADAFQEENMEVRVWLHRKRGSTDIQFARPAPAAGGDFLYAKVSDRRGVFKVPISILDAFTVNPNDLRDRNLADLDESSLSAITIEQHRRDGVILPPVRLENFGGKWALQRSGQQERADSVKITEMIKALNKERILDFSADAATDLAQFGLDQPVHRITFVKRFVTVAEDEKDKENPTPIRTEEKSKTLLLGHSPDGTKVFAKYADEPFVYRIAPHLYGFFETTQTVNWKSPELVRFSILGLRKLTVERHPSPPVVLRYDIATNSWSAESGGEDMSDRLDQKRAQAIAGTLSNFEARGWTSDLSQASRLLQDARLLTIQVEVENRADAKTENLRIVIAPTAAGEKGEFFYGRMNDMPDVFLLSRETFLTLYNPLIKP